MAAESGDRPHRDSLGGENVGNGSCRSHRRERRTDDSSIQSQRRCSALSLHRPAARRTRMHDDEYDARAAVPHCDRVRNVRPGAFQQSVSPHDRYEPVGLAPGAGDERRGQHELRYGCARSRSSRRRAADGAAAGIELVANLSSMVYCADGPHRRLFAGLVLAAMVAALRLGL